MFSLLKLALVASASVSPVLAQPVSAAAKRGADGFRAIVSVDWLSSHLEDPGLTVIDIRQEEDYEESHVPNSVNIPFELDSGWSETAPDGTILELPPVEQVQGLLEYAGVTWPSNETRVVLVSAIEGIGGNVAPARVALSIKYAGITDDRVAILSGGFPAWQAAGEEESTDVPEPEAGSVHAEENLAFISYIDEVAASIGREDEGIYLVDARPAQFFNGSEQDTYVPDGQLGHIESAVSLPTPEVFDEDGAFLSIEYLAETAEEALSEGADPAHLIVYCHIGRLASTWFLILNHLLGYENVKLYDGSTQEWAKHYDLVLPEDD